jgi:hypothetical protein
MAAVVLKSGSVEESNAQAQAEVASETNQVPGTQPGSLLVAHDLLTSEALPQTLRPGVEYVGSVKPAAVGKADALIRCTTRPKGGRGRRACASLHRAAQITAADRARFIFDALLKGLPSSMFCYHGRLARIASGWTAWFKPGSV